jgi:hypothetical protein
MLDLSDLLIRTVLILIVFFTALTPYTVTAEDPPDPTPDAIRFETNIQRIDIQEAETEVACRYPFEAQKDLTITDVVTSCGCTAASGAKGSYKAGQKGEITLLFEPGDRVGHKRNLVQVHYTSESGSGSARLMLEATIHEHLRLRPRLAAWAPDDWSTKLVQVEILPR